MAAAAEKLEWQQSRCLRNSPYKSARWCQPEQNNRVVSTTQTGGLFDKRLHIITPTSKKTTTKNIRMPYFVGMMIEDTY